MGKVLNGDDNISGIKESLGVSSQKHEETHDREWGLVNDVIDGEPNEKITGEALNGAGQENEPGGGAAAIGGDSGVEEAGENAEVRADVLEDGNGVER